MNELIQIMIEFGGGKGGEPGNNAVRFMLAAFFWAMLSLIASREWRRENKRRDLYVALAAILGISREILMFTAEYGSNRGLVSFDFMFLYYPPLEHAATMLSCTVIAFAFLQQVGVNNRFTAWFLRISIAVTLTIYGFTALDWQRFLAAHPRSSFGMYGGDMAFRVAASLIIATALTAFYCAKRKGKFVPSLLLLSFGYLFLDEFLMIINLATQERHVAILSPIRHNLHIWAIPFLIGTYWTELRHRIEEAGNFAYAVIDALSAHICVLDEKGTIIAVNRAWRESDIANTPMGFQLHEGDSYLEASERAVPGQDKYAAPLKAGIQGVMHGTNKDFSLEYSIQDSYQTGWFVAQVTRFADTSPLRLVIAHEDITERKLAEKEALAQGMQLLTLHRVSEISANADNLEDALQTIAAEIAIATRFPVIAIEQYDRDRQMMVFKGCIGFPDEIGNGLEIPVGETHSGIVVKNGEPLIETRLRERPEYQHEILRRLDVQTFVCIPMISHDQVLGVLSLGNPREVPVGERFVSWITSLANTVAAMTERKRAEESLRASEERYRTLVDNLPLGISLIDSRHRIIMANKTQAEWFRRTPESLVGQCCFEQFEKRDHICTHCPGTVSMKTGEIAQIDTVGIRDDGSNFAARLHTVPLFDDMGTATGFIEVVEDITERKKAEEDLRESEERYRQLYDAMGQGMALLEIICDGDGQPYDCRFLEVNPSYEKIVGLTKEQIVGRTVLELFPGLEEYWIDSYGRVALTGEAVTLENYAKPLDRYYRVYAYSPRIGQFAVLVNDITDQRRSEKERRRLEQQMQHAQKLESLGVLAGGIAHDFNNILLAILGHAELAMMRLNPTSPARDNLLKIEQAAQRAAELSRQMLAYSGKGKFIVEAINVGELVKEMAHMLEVSISKKAILRFNLAADLPMVEADATQLRQVLMNLVINASEAIGDKSGVIAISTGAMPCDRQYLAQTWINEQLDEGLYVYVEVADTGCGMDRETLNRIFDPFFTTKFTGRGLGMAAVMGIVRGHRGAIKAYSEPGKGTTFKLFLPAGSGRAAELRRKFAVEQLWHGSGTILLVDDEETIRALGTEMLETLGFKVITAENGCQAVDIYKEHAGEIDGVILDLTMPRMDGEEAFRELRRIKEDVCVIMSSGYNEQEVNQRFLGKRLAGFIQKPYKLDELSNVLRQALES